MRDNDQIFLEDCYSKTKKTLNEQSYENENVFISEVTVDLDDSDFRAKHPDFDFSSSAKTKVKYSLDIEYRSWGIKGIDAKAISVENFTVEYLDYSKGEDKEEEGRITVEMSNFDASKMAVEMNIGEHGSIYPVTLRLALDPDYKPIAEKSTLLFS